MQGYEAPVILKLPQGEERWAPRRLPVDIGDVMMNIRMDDSKNRFVGEHVSKYAQGSNPYGEWHYPYKVNKNNIRPPIIDPKFYEPLSRMPVKFDSITSGPIIRDTYGKRVEIDKVAPRTINDRVLAQAGTNPAEPDRSYDKSALGNIELHLRQPHASIPYHPSLPIHPHTGVPEIELDGKLITRPQMGIHAPFAHSDQSRDILNMRTPMHVAAQPGYKAPYTFVQVAPDEITQISENPGVQTAAQTNVAAPIPTFDNLTRDGYDLAPKVQTAAWYNPSYFLTELNDYGIGAVNTTCIDDKIQTAVQAVPTMNIMRYGNNDTHISTKIPVAAGRTTNISSLTAEADRGKVVNTRDPLELGSFEAKLEIPTIQEHPIYAGIRHKGPSNREKFMMSRPAFDQYNMPERQPMRYSGIREPLKVDKPPVDKSTLDYERVNPVGTGRFVHRSAF